MDDDDEPGELTLNSVLEEKDLTQKELASRLGLHWRTVSDWATGKKLPNLESAALLASELGISLKTLFKAFKVDVSGVPDDIFDGDDEE